MRGVSLILLACIVPALGGYVAGDTVIARQKVRTAAPACAPGDSLLYLKNGIISYRHPPVINQGSGITVSQSNDTFQISLYQAPEITSISNDHVTNYAGQTVTSVNVFWALSGAAIKYQAITDEGSLNIADRSHAFTSLSLTADKYYRLVVTDSVQSDTAFTWCYFYIQKYFDTCASATPSEAEIRARASTWTYQNSAYRAMSSTSKTGGGKYIYYAYPSAWGDIQISVNGFGSTWIRTTVSITNSYGDARNYYVHTSPNSIVGTVYISAVGN